MMLQVTVLRLVPVGELLEPSTYLQKTIYDNNLYVLKRFKASSGTDNKGYIFRTNLKNVQYNALNIVIHSGITHNGTHNFKTESNIKIWDYEISHHQTISFGVDNNNYSPQYMVVFVDSDNTISLYLHITSNLAGGVFKAALFDIDAKNRITDIFVQTVEYQMGSHEKELKIPFSNYNMI